MTSQNTKRLSPDGRYSWDGRQWLPRRKRQLFRSILIVEGALFALLIALSTYDGIQHFDHHNTASEQAAVAAVALATTKLKVADAPVAAPTATLQSDPDGGQAKAYYAAVGPRLSAVGTLAVKARHVCATGTLLECSTAAWDANVATLTLDQALREQNPPTCLKPMDADIKASTNTLSQGLVEIWSGVNAGDPNLVAAGGHHMEDARALMTKAYVELKAVPCGLPA